MNDFLEDDDHEEGPESTSSFDALPVALLEEALTETQVELIRRSGSFCLAVEVSTAAWAGPVATVIRRMSDWDRSEVQVSPVRSRSGTDSVDPGRLVRSLSEGGRIFGVAPRLELLAEPLRNAADLTIRLGRPTPAVLARTIEMVVGERPLMLADDIVQGLDFEEIIACIRVGSSVDECIKRLERLRLNKAQSAAMTADVPELSDLHGYGAAMEWAQQLLNDLGEWRKGAVSFQALSRMAVLASPTGLGKTTFVRSLAKSSGLPLIETSVGKWFAQSPGYLDSIIKQIDQTFAAANARAPAIIFLDECDAIPSRVTMSPRGGDWWTPVVTHILTSLDGATAEAANLIVIGATNHPEKLDPALVRPGRLSRIIHIEPPDQAAIVGILRQHLSGELAGEDLAEAARLGAGSTGAQLADYVKRARGAARSRRRPIALQDLVEAIAPADDRSRHLIERVAIHEVGHAVTGHFAGFAPVESISIVPQDVSDGRTRFSGSRELSTRSRIESFVVQALGGRAAEEVFFGDGGTGSGGHAVSDLAVATRKLGMAHLSLGLGDTLIYRGDEEDVPHLLRLDPRIASMVEAELQRHYAEAVRIIRERRALVEAIANELVAHRHMGGERFLEIVEDFHPSTPEHLAAGGPGIER